MKLKYLMMVVALFATPYCFAQFSIVGNVKDEKTNEAISKASVYINDVKIGTQTNINGDYAINNVKKGTYIIEISVVGHQTKIERIIVDKNIVLNFRLSTAVSELNEVVVTAVTRSTELKRSPIIIKAVDKNTLNQNSATNLIDALKNVPGVSQITTGASISKPIIRGLGYNRVITLNNGIRQEGQQWGDEHSIEIDEYAVDKIEIVKGPGSLMYGSDGIAGVINFLSPKSLHKNENKTQLVTNYQTNNNLIGYSLSNGGNKNGVQWLGRFSNKFAGNYKNKYDGKVYNSGFNEVDGNLFLGVNKNWGHTHFNISSFNTTLNLIEGDRDSTGKFIFVLADGSEKRADANDLKGYKIGFPHQNITHTRIASNNYFILHNATVNADIALQNSKRKEFGDVTKPNDKALYFDLNTFNYNVRYNLAEKNEWETSFGIGGMLQNNKNKGLEFLIPEYNLFDAGVFVFAQKQFNKKLIFAAGLRYDNRVLQSKELILDSDGVPTPILTSTTELKFSAFKQNYNGISGSAGLSYLINKTSTFKFNVSRGFRAPNIAELASNGRHEGTFRYEIGTSNLQSEISHQIDAAYFLNEEHVTVEFTPFANFITNYIYVEKLKDALGNDVIPNPADPAPAFKFVQGNATLLGGEVYLDFHPHPLDWLHIENSFSYVQATQNSQIDSSKYLPFIPAPKYRGELKAQFNKLGKNLTNAYIKFGLDYFFKQNNFYKAYETETTTPAYTLLSASIGTNVKINNKKDCISFFISGENLANVAYQNHLSRLKYAPQNIQTGRNGVFNMGRNISIKMILNL